MTTDPLFSIVTVTRGNLAGLQNTYASLQRQFCRDFEWIVIDGASSDGTQDWLREQKIPFISEPDCGPYDAMNKGLNRACGVYAMFLNAGDALAFADTLARLKNVRADFIYGDALETTNSGNLAYKHARSHHHALLGMFTHHQAMLYARACIGSLRYDLDYRVAADYDFTLRFLQKARVVSYHPFPVCLYQSGGLSQQNAALGREEEFRVRRTLGLCLPVLNAAIRARQSVAWAVRRAAPALYHRCKA